MKLGEVSYNNNGNKEGKWNIWDDNGNLRAEMHYINGERKGSWKIWDENGVLLKEMNY